MTVVVVGTWHRRLLTHRVQAVAALGSLIRMFWNKPARAVVAQDVLDGPDVDVDIIMHRLNHIWVYEHDYLQLSAVNRTKVVAQRHEVRGRCGGPAGGSVIFHTECEVGYITRLLTEMLERGIASAGSDPRCARTTTGASTRPTRR